MSTGVGAGLTLEVLHPGSAIMFERPRNTLTGIAACLAAIHAFFAAP